MLRDFRVILLLLYLLLPSILHATAQTQSSTSSTSSVAVAPTSTESKALMPSVDLDLSLVYWDKLGLPGSGTLSYATPDSTSSSYTPAALETVGSRALGLDRARVGLNWMSINRSGVKLVLRPDYSHSSGAPTRELDSRAGDVYTLSPSVKLLDAYSVVLNSMQSFAIEIGVFEELLPRRAVYPELLEFGLNVALPRKFSGAKVNWLVEKASTTGPSIDSNHSKFQFMFVALQGSDDRSDSVKIGRRTFDTGPASKDPYAGGAAYIGWIPSHIFSAGVLLGTGDHAFSRIIDVDQGTLATRGRRSETFGSLAATLKVGQQKKNRIGLDFRLAHDSFVLTEGKASPLNQRSVSITYAAPIIGVLHGFVGLHSGTSQQHDSTDATKTKDVEGYQTDLGMLYAIDHDLEFALMAAWERRSIKASEGSRIGGFGDESPKNSIQRLGVRMNYFIPGS